MLSHHFQKTGWKSFLFDDIASSISDRVDDPRLSGVDRYVGLEHLDSQSIKIRRWGEPGDVSATKLRFYPGDVIYGRRRAYQRKLGVADFEGICSAHALVLRAKEDVCLAKFLPYFLQTDLFHQKALDISVGSLSPTINWKTLARQKFFLPSIKDQEKIIEIISSIDKTIEAYQDLPLKSQRESMLHEFLFADGDDWTKTTLGDVALINPEATKNFEDDKIITYVDLSSVSAEHGISKELSIGPYQNAPGRARRVIRTDDVLISTVRPYLRGFAIVPEYLDGEVASTGFSVLRAKIERTIPGFIWALISTGQFVDFLMDKASGSNYPAVRPEDVSSYDFDLPPLKEQRRIVEIVSSMDDVIQSTEQAIRDLKVLRRSLLTEILSVNDNG
jgi:type I restriction enzyme S subunit